MRDATLRRGDVIVTDEAWAGFCGARGLPHSVADFQTLAEARALPRQERTVLVAIENVMKTKQSGRRDDRIVASDPRIKPEYVEILVAAGQ